MKSTKQLVILALFVPKYCAPVPLFRYSFHVNWRNVRADHILRVSVEYESKHGSSLVTFQIDGLEATARYPVFRIDNTCEETVFCRQFAADGDAAPDRTVIVLPPDSSAGIVFLACVCLP